MKSNIRKTIITAYMLLIVFSLEGVQAAVCLDGTLPVLTVKSAGKDILLSWQSVAGADEYIIYQSESRFGTYKRIVKLSSDKTSFRATGNRYAYYRLHACSAGHEKVSSAPQSLETEIFGSNTLIFAPQDTPETVNAAIEKVTKELTDGKISQFTNRRQALLFKPGRYDWLSFENGFYMHVAGLGFSPEETSLERVSVNTNWLGGNNATCNFWRTLENVTLLNRTGSFKYGVSQAAPLRRLKIHGKMSLDMGGWASGGYLANSVATDTIGSTSQQQFFLRNNELNYFWGVNWNLVSVGDKGTFEPIANRTLIDRTPVVYEKPFLYFSDGDYRVFVPGRRTDANGTTWSNGKLEQGTTIDLDRFYVARADRDDDQTLNKQLKQGKHLLFTPGIYRVASPLVVSCPNTVILGLGLASIQPTAGNNAMEVNDVEGVRIAGLIFDAGSGMNSTSSTGGSPVLLRVGKPGSVKKLDHNPIVLSDLFFRVGGVDTPLPCRADVSLEINAHATIGDHFWIWRADHGQQVAWELNKADYGLVVNADDVTIYGLFAEHYQKYDTYWKGDNGRAYFYQNEKAYDVPTQQDWMSPDGKGWAAYRVADNVKKHQAWGVGVYSVFINTKDFVVMDNAILTPPEGDITIHYPFTMLLSTQGGIGHIINGVGGPHTNKESQRGSRAVLPAEYNNVWQSKKETAIK